MTGVKKAVPALCAALAVAAVWSLWPGEPVELSIPPGLTAKQTAALLREDGVTPSAFLFRAAAKLTGADRRLLPGDYRLRRRMWLPALLRQLEEGSNAAARIVIPEGFSAKQIAERLEKDGVCRASDFEVYAATSGLEGYLFPTTYFFVRNTPAPVAAQRMALEFKKRVEPLYDKEAAKPPLSLHQTLTLASIVEREAVLAPERPMIAAVYLNRLKLRMRLQADPTVQYALGFWKKGLTSADLKTPSPYNTYLHYGLPPGPICNPGLDSFQAALRPAQTDALYFVADTTGAHKFSATQAEQVQAKRSYKRALRAIKARLKAQKTGS